MHDLTRELEALRASGDAPPAALRHAHLRESRAVFSIRPELLALFYVSIALLVAGVGLLVRRNLDQIGPLALLGALLVAAASSNVAAVWLRRRPGGRRTLAVEYLPLLGALLLSSAVGIAEYQFRWLGAEWSRHLLLLAVAHAVAAYAFGSRLVLAVALTALAGWFGVETSLGSLWDPQRAWSGFGVRALGCAALFVALRFAHRRLDGRDVLTRVYEQFAANLAFWGALGLAFRAETRLLGLLVLAALAWAAWSLGMVRRQESLVVYAVGYAAIGVCVVLGQWLAEPLLVSILCTAIVVGATVLIWRTRSRLRAAVPAT
jgi:hypothetical protein